MDSDDEFEWFMRVIEKQDISKLQSPIIEEQPVSETINDHVVENDQRTTDNVEYDPNLDPMLLSLLNEMKVAEPTEKQKESVDRFNREHELKLKERGERQAQLQQQIKDKTVKSTTNHSEHPNIVTSIEDIWINNDLSTSDSSSPVTQHTNNTEKPENTKIFGQTSDKSIVGIMSSVSDMMSMIPKEIIDSRGPAAMQKHMMLHMSLMQDDMSAEELPPEQLVDRRLPSVDDVGVGVGVGGIDDIDGIDSVIDSVSEIDNVNVIDDVIDDGDIEDDEYTRYLRKLDQTILQNTKIGVNIDRVREIGVGVGVGVGESNSIDDTVLGLLSLSTIIKSYVSTSPLSNSQSNSQSNSHSDSESDSLSNSESNSQSNSQSNSESNFESNSQSNINPSLLCRILSDTSLPTPSILSPSLSLSNTYLYSLQTWLHVVWLLVESVSVVHVKTPADKQKNVKLRKQPSRQVRLSSKYLHINSKTHLHTSEEEKRESEAVVVDKSEYTDVLTEALTTHISILSQIFDYLYNISRNSIIPHSSPHHSSPHHSSPHHSSPHHSSPHSSGNLTHSSRDLNVEASRDLNGNGGKCVKGTEWAEMKPLFVKFWTTYCSQVAVNAVTAKFEMQPDVDYSILSADGLRSVVINTLDVDGDDDSDGDSDNEGDGDGDGDGESADMLGLTYFLSLKLDIDVDMSLVKETFISAIIDMNMNTGDGVGVGVGVGEKEEKEIDGERTLAFSEDISLPVDHVTESSLITSLD